MTLVTVGPEYLRSTSVVFLRVFQHACLRYYPTTPFRTRSTSWLTIRIYDLTRTSIPSRTSRSKLQAFSQFIFFLLVFLVFLKMSWLLLVFFTLQILPGTSKATDIRTLRIFRVANFATIYALKKAHFKSAAMTWRNKTRIKQQSYLTRATTLLPEYNLPCSRGKIATVAPQPLYKTAYQPTLCPHLIVKSASKADPAHILKSLAAEIIDTYPNTMTHVDTDGSALNEVQQAGYGLTIQYPDAMRKDISEACGQHCNNYDTELKAIRSALQTISNDCDNPNPPCVNSIVIFTDSQSAILAIAQMQHHKQPIVTDILTTANKLHNQNDVETSIQWIPGHCDIPGNNRADKLARQGTSKAQHDEHVSYATSKQIIQTKSRTIWHDRWARGNPGRTYYQHQQTPNQTDPINQLYRAHHTAIFAPEHTTHRSTHTYIASRKITLQSVSTATTVMRLLSISCSTAHCTQHQNKTTASPANDTEHAI